LPSVPARKPEALKATIFIVDHARWIQEDTIPLLLKEIQSRGLKDKKNFRFCVTPTENKLVVDGLALGILKNIQSKDKPSFALVTTKFRTESNYSYRGFGGSISLSPDF